MAKALYTSFTTGRRSGISQLAHAATSNSQASPNPVRYITATQSRFQGVVQAAAKQWATLSPAEYSTWQLYAGSAWTPWQYFMQAAFNCALVGVTQPNSCPTLPISTATQVATATLDTTGGGLVLRVTYTGPLDPLLGIWIATAGFGSTGYTQSAGRRILRLAASFDATTLDLFTVWTNTYGIVQPQGRCLMGIHCFDIRCGAIQPAIVAWPEHELVQDF